MWKAKETFEDSGQWEVDNEDGFPIAHSLTKETAMQIEADHNRCWKLNQWILRVREGLSNADALIPGMEMELKRLEEMGE